MKHSIVRMSTIMWIGRSKMLTAVSVIDDNNDDNDDNNDGNNE